MTSPYSVYSSRLSVICQAVLNKLETAPEATWTLVPQYFAYGDQDRIPNTPAICVEPGDKTRELTGAPDMTDNSFDLYVIIYHNKVQGNETTRLEVDVLAEEVEYYLHQDLQLTEGGVPRLIHGYVRQQESGYAYKDKSIYRTTRLTYYGKNKTSLSGL